MSLAWDRSISIDRIYLPAEERFERDKDNDGVPIDEEIQNYTNREFPLPKPDSNDVLCYSIPKTFIQHGEPQACQAELNSYQRLCNVQLPNDSEERPKGPVWQACFQGICYAGRSYRNSREGKFMTKEHDLVVFNIYQGKYYISLIEVKSICDDPSVGIVSDSSSIKNNKRSGQHQLRDHVEILKDVCKIPEDSLHCYLFWPFLSMWTNDPRGNKVRRWDKEMDQHVFIDTLSEQENFNQWFYKNVLCGKSIEKSHFDTLFKRFIILSSGIFVNEIHEGMLALLSQQQVNLIYKKPSETGEPTVVHGAAGTGKTLLILHKLNLLYEQGLLNHKNRALYICYWQGIRKEFCQKLEKLKISEYVDTAIFHITRDGFFDKNVKKYRHIFMDECEAICLAFKEEIITNTFKNIYDARQTDYDEEYYKIQNNLRELANNSENSTDCIEEQKKEDNVNANINHPTNLFGDLWFLVDINQATIFLPKYAPSLLKKPTITLSKVLRNTGTIYGVFSQFYKNPTPTITSKAGLSELYLNNINLGHNIAGPPIYWVDSKNFDPEPVCDDIHSSRTFNGLIRVIIDLYSSKGIKPHDMCVLPFFIGNAYIPKNINKAISSFFTSSYQPTSITDVEEFVGTSDQNKFLVPWALRVKGLEFKAVIIVIEEDDDFDYLDTEDRRKIYIMASRCTCLLILVSTESVKDMIDVFKVIKAYPFDVTF